MGANRVLMIGDKYVGHFYIDPSNGINAVAILDQMVAAWNVIFSADCEAISGTNTSQDN